MTAPGCTHKPHKDLRCDSRKGTFPRSLYPFLPSPLPSLAPHLPRFLLPRLSAPRIVFRGEPRIVDLTTERKLANQVREAYLHCTDAERDEVLYYLLVK